MIRSIFRLRPATSFMIRNTKNGRRMDITPTVTTVTRPASTSR